MHLRVPSHQIGFVLSYLPSPHLRARFGMQVGIVHVYALEMHQVFVGGTAPRTVAQNQRCYNSHVGNVQGVETRTSEEYIIFLAIFLRGEGRTMVPGENRTGPLEASRNTPVDKFVAHLFQASRSLPNIRYR